MAAGQDAVRPVMILPCDSAGALFSIGRPASACKSAPMMTWIFIPASCFLQDRLARLARGMRMEISVSVTLVGVAMACADLLSMIVLAR